MSHCDDVLLVGVIVFVIGMHLVVIHLVRLLVCIVLVVIVDVTLTATGHKSSPAAAVRGSQEPGGQFGLHDAHRGGRTEARHVIDGAGSHSQPLEVRDKVKKGRVGGIVEPGHYLQLQTQGK